MSMTLPKTSLASQGDKPKLWQTLSLRIGFIVFLIVAWEMFVRVSGIRVYLVPPPIGVQFAPEGGLELSKSSVLSAFIAIISDGSLRESLQSSLFRMFLGYGISIIGGISIGVLVARNWFFKQTIGSLILALQSLPSICWLPFALIWVGLNEGAILFVIILGALFSIAISTEGAIRNVPPIYTKVGRTLGAKRFVLAKDILFFAALPELLGGLKVGWTFAWRSLMAAELIRQDVVGIGSLLQVGRDFNDMALMFAAVLTILAVGLTVDTLVFGQAERTIRRRYGLER